MSRESKKRTKEWLAKPGNIVLSRDVVRQQSAATVSGVVTHTTLAEGSSALSYAAKAGKLDGVVFTCSPALASGQLDVSLSLNGAVVASGALTSAVRAFDFKAGDDTEQALAAGDVLGAAYAVSAVLSHDGTTARQVTARILLSYGE